MNLILGLVDKKYWYEVKNAFGKALKARKAGKAAEEIVDLWFYETVVRLHRWGEGAEYTGLKPAGLHVGPVIPRAEEAFKTGKLDELSKFMTKTLNDELYIRFERAWKKRNYDINNPNAAREYWKASLGFQVWAHHLFTHMKAGGHAHGEKEEGQNHKH